MSLDAMQHLPMQGTVLSEWLQGGCRALDAPIQSVLALLPETEAMQLPVLQQACKDAGVFLLGAMFPCLIDGHEFRNDGVLLLPSPYKSPAFLLSPLDGNPEKAGQQLADAAKQTQAHWHQQEPTARSDLFLIFDSQLKQVASVVENAYLHLDGELRLLGVNAGSQTFQPVPCLFDADRFVGDGVIGILLPPVVSSALTLQSGELNELYTVTSSHDNCVATINGRPAFEIYRDLVRRDYGFTLTPENFYTHAVHYPFALAHGDGQMLYRIPVRLGTDGAVTCVGEIPEFSVLSVINAPNFTDMQCISRLTEAMDGAAVGGQSVVFYCAGRSLHFGDESRHELRELAQQMHVVSQVGALVLGEIGNPNSWGYPLFYNGAVIGMGWKTA